MYRKGGGKNNGRLDERGGPGDPPVRTLTRWKRNVIPPGAPTHVIVDYSPRENGYSRSFPGGDAGDHIITPAYPPGKNGHPGSEIPDRNGMFLLGSEVLLFGGYTGREELYPKARDPLLYLSRVLVRPSGQRVVVRMTP